MVENNISEMTDSTKLEELNPLHKLLIPHSTTVSDHSGCNLCKHHRKFYFKNHCTYLLTVLIQQDYIFEM